MNTEQATPRPWIREGTTIYTLQDNPYRSKKEHPEQINRFWAGINGQGVSKEETEATAAYIVTALNSHDALVEAAKNTEAFIAGLLGMELSESLPEYHRGFVAGMLSNLRAAIKLAEGQS